MSSRGKRSVFDIIDEYFKSLEGQVERLNETLFERPSWNCRSCTMEPLRGVMVTPIDVIVTVDLPYSENYHISQTNREKHH